MRRCLVVMILGVGCLAGPGQGAGWRFHLPHVTWPANTWTGQEYPLTGVSSLTPASWATLTFSPDPLEEPKALFEANSVSVPAATGDVGISGTLGTDEWRDAQTVLYRYAPGKQLAVMLKHSETHLLVGVALPGERAPRQGAFIEFCWQSAASGEGSVGPESRLLRALVGSGGQSQLLVGTGRRGAWECKLTDRRNTPLRGVINNTGDGGWSYLAAEFALPLSLLGGTAEALPGAVRCLVHVQTTGAGGRMTSRPQPLRETLAWPDSRSSYARLTPSRLPERPALWGRLALAEALYDALVVPRVVRPVQVDGNLLPEEWEGAAALRYPLPGGQGRTFWVARDDDNLYVAARWTVARGLRRNEQCRVFLDVLGDGGLTPREDDLRFTLTAAAPNAVRVEHWNGTAWEEVGSSPVRGVLRQTSPCDSQCELALPLGQAERGEATPGLAVEVSYDLSQS